ncbi:hypothetical protein [Massilia sp.]|uniref:hypothetical protein n=1 Tax=Massilia sp. TaxID=1882437 RepID=UPI0028A1980C|nr:hypothetical protein [Massilia sp.]
MQKTECLFIGGPWDGRYLSVDAEQPTLHAPVKESAAGPSFDEPAARPRIEVVYRRAELRSLDRAYVVYVAADEPGTDVIGSLIAGYRARPDRE